MKVAEISVRNLLGSTIQFQIPLFQRPYSWQQTDWETLWEDLMRLYNLYNNESETEQVIHFLGSIVTQSLPGTADSITPYLVIDGQQRLITLTIILSSLQHTIKKMKFPESDKLVEELYESYLINKFKKGNDYYKILPTSDDQNVYISMIKESFNETFKDKLILKAYIFFVKQFKNLEKQGLQEQKMLNFLKFKYILLERLILINITSEEKDNPYLIFESLNYKGEELTQADLLRGYIFMKLPRQKREKIYKEKWLPHETSFKNIIKNEVKYADIMTNSFWFYLRKDGESINLKEVYKEIKKRFENTKEPENELDQIIKFSKYYQNIAFKDIEKEKTLQKYFSRLNRLDFSTCHIFLLNIYDDYHEKRLSIDDFEKILIYLESYFIRRFFINKSTRPLGKIFDNLYKEVSQTMKEKNLKTLADGVYMVLDSYEGEKIWPSDDEFRLGIMTRPIYKRNSNDRVKLFLETLESSQTKEIVNFTNLSIEHIMPQKLNKDWKTILGDKSTEVHKKWVHTLGNLTLTGYNSELSNSPFDKKCQLFTESNVFLNKYLCQLNTWNEESIKNRANHLADLTIKVWPRQTD
jgi:uncharacterized protein with ParB-like and HNH nuclease domain